MTKKHAKLPSMQRVNGPHVKIMKCFKMFTVSVEADFDSDKTYHQQTTI